MRRNAYCHATRRNASITPFFISQQYGAHLYTEGLAGQEDE